MSDPRTRYPSGIGRKQIVPGTPTGHVCPQCTLPIERGQVRILMAGQSFHGPCSVARRRLLRA